MLRSVFAPLSDVRGYQLRDGPGRIHALVVPGAEPGFVAARVAAALRNELAAVGARVEVSVETIDRLERTPGHAGKLQTIVRAADEN